jgi:hypothetical protein
MRMNGIRWEQERLVHYDYNEGWVGGREANTDDCNKGGVGKGRPVQDEGNEVKREQGRQIHTI